MASVEQLGLTGVWDGLFSYPRRYASVPFTATILHTGSLITGSIHEHPAEGPTAGQTRLAMIEGGCSASSIWFLKTYEPPPPHGKPISYEGAISPDATEIEGRWTIPGNWSGKFLMMRSGRGLEARTVKRKAVSPVG
jgi:hypothetical protein